MSNFKSNCKYFKNDFCYVCGQKTMYKQRCEITPAVAKSYKYCFDQDVLQNSYSPNIICKNCRGKVNCARIWNSKVRLPTPFQWTAPNDDHSNCHFCLHNQKSIAVVPENQPFTIKPILVDENGNIISYQPLIEDMNILNLSLIIPMVEEGNVTEMNSEPVIENQSTTQSESAIQNQPATKSESAIESEPVVVKRKRGRPSKNKDNTSDTFVKTKKIKPTSREIGQPVKRRKYSSRAAKVKIELGSSRSPSKRRVITPQRFRLNSSCDHSTVEADENGKHKSDYENDADLEDNLDNEHIDERHLVNQVKKLKVNVFDQLDKPCDCPIINLESFRFFVCNPKIVDQRSLDEFAINLSLIQRNADENFLIFKYKPTAPFVDDCRVVIERFGPSAEEYHDKIDEFMKKFNSTNYDKQEQTNNQSESNDDDVPNNDQTTVVQLTDIQRLIADLQDEVILQNSQSIDENQSEIQMQTTPIDFTSEDSNEDRMIIGEMICITTGRIEADKSIEDQKDIAANETIDDNKNEKFESDIQFKDEQQVNAQATDENNQDRENGQTQDNVCEMKENNLEQASKSVSQYEI